MRTSVVASSLRDFANHGTRLPQASRLWFVRKHEGKLVLRSEATSQSNNALGNAGETPATRETAGNIIVLGGFAPA